MIFVDSNVPMYAVGGPHPLKSVAIRLVDEALDAGEVLVTSAEVFQEILHRYSALRRPADLAAAWTALAAAVEEVFPLEHADVARARDLVDATPGISARDATHAGVMQGRGIDTILSFDQGFDGIPWIRRRYR